MKRLRDAAERFNVQPSDLDPSEITPEAQARWDDIRSVDVQGFQYDPRAVERQSRFLKIMLAAAAVTIAAVGVTVAALATANRGPKYDPSAEGVATAPEFVNAPNTPSKTPSKQTSTKASAAAPAPSASATSSSPSAKASSPSPSASPTATQTSEAAPSESASASASASTEANASCSLDASASTISCDGTIDAYEYASGTTSGNTDLGAITITTINACDISGNNNEISVTAYGGSWAFLPLPGVPNSELQQLEAACQTSSPS